MGLECAIVIFETDGDYNTIKFWTGDFWCNDIKNAKLYLDCKSAEEAIFNNTDFSCKVKAHELVSLRSQKIINWLDHSVISPVEFEHDQG